MTIDCSEHDELDISEQDIGGIFIAEGGSDERTIHLGGLRVCLSYHQYCSLADAMARFEEGL